MQEELYWEAVMNRDSHADGAFVYAVRSTGIYCQPSCSSRRPGRKQVVFFTLPEEAEKAGFRPCRRCHPGTSDTGDQTHIALVQQLCIYIETHLEEPVTLAILGEQCNMSPYHIQRIFKQVMGITPLQYAEAYRMKQFKARLRQGESVTSAMFDVGYSSSSRLYERTGGHLGMKPATYRQGGYGMHINYTIVDSPLGRLLVAATERGISFVSLGDTDDTLITVLMKEYPAATITHDDNSLSEWVNAILQHLHGQQPHLSLPLDVRATAFQWRVWRELQNIPYGQTRSYSEIARALGDKNKARAVARACATNPVAIAVPCHRVVREDGVPGGYRWGNERKLHLLAQEQATYYATSNDDAIHDTQPVVEEVEEEQREFQVL